MAIPKELGILYDKLWDSVDMSTITNDSIYLFKKDFKDLTIDELAKIISYQNHVKNPEWRKVFIYGNETKYSVNNLGDIRNDNNPSLILAKKNSRCGYYLINLTVLNRDGNMKRKTFSVHLIVANAFIPNPENKPMVNHINGNKQCNCIENLEWVTAKENVHHAISTGLSKVSGINNPRNIYEEKIIHKICKMLENGIEPIKIARTLNVHKHVVNNIKARKNWTIISSQYKIPPVVNLKKPDGFRDEICELIMAGYSNLEIVDIMGLDKNDDIKGRGYVDLVRRRFLKGIYSINNK